MASSINHNSRNLFVEVTNIPVENVPKIRKDISINVNLSSGKNRIFRKLAMATGRIPRSLELEDQGLEFDNIFQSQIMTLLDLVFGSSNVNAETESLNPIDNQSPNSMMESFDVQEMSEPKSKPEPFDFFGKPEPKGKPGPKEWGKQEPKAKPEPFDFFGKPEPKGKPGPKEWGKVEPKAKPEPFDFFGKPEPKSKPGPQVITDGQQQLRGNSIFIELFNSLLDKPSIVTYVQDDASTNTLDSSSSTSFKSPCMESENNEDEDYSIILPRPTYYFPNQMQSPFEMNFIFPDSTTTFFNGDSATSLLFPLGSDIVSSVAVTQDETELLRAELDLLSTPISGLYAETAFYALAEARSQCFQDVVTLCPETLPMTFSSDSMIAFSRALSTRRRMDGERGHHHKHGRDHDKERNHENKDNVEVEGEDRHHEHKHDDEHKDWKHRNENRNHMEDENNNHMDRDEHHDHHDHDHHHGGKDRDHHHHNHEERDNGMLYMDAMMPLGWGVNTDQCLLAQWSALSQPCQVAAIQVQNVRNAFVEDDIWFNRHAYHHHHHVGFFILLLGVVGGAYMFFKRRTNERKEVTALLTALNANPDLKAQIEAITSTPVPDVVAKRVQHGSNGGSCIFKTILKLSLVFFGALILVHIAACMTRFLVIHMSVIDEETGELQLPSPFVVVSVMIGVVLFLTTGVVSIARYFIARNRAAAATSTAAGTGASNSNTPMQNQYLMNQFRNNGSNNDGPSSSSSLPAPSAPPANLFPTFPYVYNGFLMRRNDVAAPDGYVALRSEEEQPAGPIRTIHDPHASNIIERPITTPVALF
eukprot:gene1817-3524_t